MTLHTSFTLALIVLMFPYNILAASFDCAKASGEMEVAICSNDTLSTLDGRLSKVYFYLKNAQLTRESEILLNQQREWLKTRQVMCPSLGSQCLTEQYEARIFELEKRYKVTFIGKSFDFSGAVKGAGYCSKFIHAYGIFKIGQTVCPTQVSRILKSHNISCDYRDDWDGEKNEAICTLAQLVFKAKRPIKSLLNADPIAPPSTLPVIVNTHWTEERGRNLLGKTFAGEVHEAPLSKNLPAHLSLLLRADYNGDGLEDAIYVASMHDSKVSEIALITRTDPSANRLLYNSRRIYCASRFCAIKRGLGKKPSKRISCGTCPG